MGLKKHQGDMVFNLPPYYDDEECEKLEETIRIQSDFSRCRVKKLSIVDTFGDNIQASEDPFAIISNEGTLMAWLTPQELEILGNPDYLLAYLTVEAERTKIADKFDFDIMITSVLSMVIGLALVFEIIFGVGHSLTQLQIGVILATIGISIICVFVLYRKIRRKRNLLIDSDIKFARETPEFCEALRMLASQSDTFFKIKTANYAKRHKLIQNALLSRN